MEILLVILVSIFMIILLILVSRLIFDKSLKEFHIRFGFKTGFDISGSFYNKN